VTIETQVDEIRSLAREFAAAELRPHAEAWDNAGALPAEPREQLAELGFFSMRVPEAQGGMGFDTPTFTAALEELAWGEPTAALIVAIAAIAAETILAHGTNEQQEKWLNGIAAGEFVATMPLQPGGSAVQRADGQLAGSLAWLADARSATLAIVAVGGDRWLVPLDAAGVTLAEPHATMGLRALAAADGTLADVQISDEHRLGGGGADDALAAFSRLAVAAVAVGISRAALDHALEYAAVREQFGRPIREFEGIAHKLAEMRVRTDAARSLLDDAARAYETRNEDGAAGRAAMLAALGARIVAADAAMWVTTQAVQVFGGYGYMRDYPVEKLMRDARAAALLLGENDAMRSEIARALYNV